MAQYISKSALVAEIKKEIKDIYAGREYVGIPSWEEREIDGLEKAIKILNTLEVKEVDFEEGLKTQNKNIWHPMSETAEHPCAVLMHGYGNDVWIADAVETLEQGAAQEWAYMDDVLTVLGLKAKGE